MCTVRKASYGPLSNTTTEEASWDTGSVPCLASRSTRTGYAWLPAGWTHLFQSSLRKSQRNSLIGVYNHCLKETIRDLFWGSLLIFRHSSRHCWRFFLYYALFFCIFPSSPESCSFLEKKERVLM